jgi:hypothetical protein
MPYYEYEFVVQNLIDILKEKQEAEEGQHRDSSQMNPSKYMKDAGNMMSGLNKKMPNMSSLSSFPGIPASLKI